MCQSSHVADVDYKQKRKLCSATLKRFWSPESTIPTMEMGKRQAGHSCEVLRCFEIQFWWKICPQIMCVSSGDGSFAKIVLQISHFGKIVSVKVQNEPNLILTIESLTIQRRNSRFFRQPTHSCDTSIFHFLECWIKRIR